MLVSFTKICFPMPAHHEIYVKVSGHTIIEIWWHERKLGPDDAQWGIPELSSWVDPGANQEPQEGVVVWKGAVSDGGEVDPYTSTLRPSPTIVTINRAERGRLIWSDDTFINQLCLDFY